MQGIESFILPQDWSQSIQVVGIHCQDTLLHHRTGVDLGIFVTSFRARNARKSSAEGVRFIGGSEGMLPLEILKSRVSEMPFPALWGNLIEGI